MIIKQGLLWKDQSRFPSFTDAVSDPPIAKFRAKVPPRGHRKLTGTPGGFGFDGNTAKLGNARHRTNY